jgi:hypothetical protein
MQLVEQHVIKQTDARYEIIDQAAFASKNLYNAANYEVRQSYIKQGVYLNYNQDPSKFLGRPTLPKYKDKQQGLYHSGAQQTCFMQGIDLPL